MRSRFLIMAAGLAALAASQYVSAQTATGSGAGADPASAPTATRPTTSAPDETASRAQRAQVQSGVDAWKAGDFLAAVRRWLAPANAGHADAQFNMGQAYKLGRGVPPSLADAENWFRRAADQGHLQAEDNLGLILFTSGHRDAAMPYIHRSAARGEARAQFLLGTAHFNGDLAPKNWPRAYALIQRASETGLSLAKNRLAELDRLIPADQRQQGLAMLPDLRRAEDAARSALAPPAPVQVIELPPSNLSANLDAATASDEPAPTPRRTPGISFTPPPETPRGTPGIAPPQAATPAATPVPQNEPPAAEIAAPLAFPAHADENPPAPKTPSPPTPEMAPPTPEKAAPQPAPKPVTQSPVNSKWRLQLGAFSVPENARNLWKSLSSRHAEIRGRTPIYRNSGRLTRLLAGEFANQQQAASLCARLRSTGQSCILISE